MSFASPEALVARLPRVFTGLSLLVSWRQAAQLRLIRESGLFDRGFYRRRVGWNAWLLSRLRPELHYLTFGARDGLDPSDCFDTRWYRDTYPDVEAEGINPLVHFLRHGAREGRLPAGHVVLSDLPDFKGTAAYLHVQLWSGFAHLAIPRLVALSRERDHAACWNLAAWLYSQGRYQHALSYLEVLTSDGAAGNGPVLVAMLKCWLRLGHEQRVLERLAAGWQERLSVSQRHFIEASLTERPTSERLASLNALLGSQSLAPLEVRDPDLPLSLANLATLPVAALESEMPRVSVVVPAFNAADTLPIALRSLLAQSWSNLEILVVDDASDDATAEVALAFADQDDRVRLLRHADNRGAYAARNTGMHRATGDYVTVHDSDDWSHPQKIERQMAALLAHPEARAVITNWARVDERLAFTGGWCLDDAFVERSYSSLLLPRALLDEVGDWDPVRVSSDGEFISRLEQHFGAACLHTVHPELPLAFSLTHPASLTQCGATHVRTVFYGLRQLYHHAAQWWHRRQRYPFMASTRERRHFPAPLGNLLAPAERYDIAFVADMSAANPRRIEILEALLALCWEGASVVVVHWPAPENFHSQWMSDDALELCHQEGLAIAHPDIAIDCDRLCLYSVAELAAWPDRVPRLSVAGAVENLAAGTVMEDAEARPLLAYFARGGLSVEELVADVA